MKRKIALIGRPNVGKSALFNRLCQKRKAIVSDEEGVTRDCLYAEIETDEKSAILIDTGGIDFHANRTGNQQILQQSQQAIVEADTVVFVVDALVGPTHLDREIALLLLRSKKEVILVINKIDDEEKEFLAQNFYSLGIENVIFVSAVHGYNISQLLKQIFAGIPESIENNAEEKGMKIAIVGKTNVGKSTLFNTLIGQERSMVSPEIATTRDSVDTAIWHGQKQYLFIDTAGIRKKRSETSPIEKFAAIRTQDAIKRSDICMILLDAQEGISTFEKRVIASIEKEKKGAIVVVNKWDMVKNIRMEHYQKALQKEVPYFHYPICFVSAKNKKNIFSIFPLIAQVEKALFHKISTPELNKSIEKYMQMYAPPQIKGKRLRIYYLTQKSVNPLQFILFVNYPELLLPSYKKYLINSLRKEHHIYGAPITFQVCKRSQKRIF
ncbi:MAG: ribosome biogenesis GTPase Der [Parachlamydiales bacterium]|nr:ribosome biogenesis GTPase Der [Parachlamydiales bacterium]